MLTRALPLMVAFLLLGAACGSSTTPVPTPTPTPSLIPSPIPSPSPVALTCNASGTASSDWPAAPTASSSPAITSAILSGDTLTLTFLVGTPAFSVTQTASPHFNTDPQGAPVTLAGTNGTLIHLTGLKGAQSNYAGATSQTSTGPMLLQVNKLGDFEGVFTLGAGTSALACTSVTSSANTLTFQFITPPIPSASTFTMMGIGPGTGVVSGTVIITPSASSFTVVVDLTGLTPNSSHPSHIHTGTGCSANGPVALALQPVVADSSGHGTATSVLPQSYVVPATGWYVNVHQGPDLIGPHATAIACAAIQ